MKQKLKNFALMNLGIILTTIGVYFFKIPNGFSTGGVSGIAVIVSGFAQQYLPNIAHYITSGNVLTVINILLLLVGLVVLGKGFSVKTVYCSLLFSFGTFALEHLWPMTEPFTDQPFLELVYAILLTAIGSALLFLTESFIPLLTTPQTTVLFHAHTVTTTTLLTCFSFAPSLLSLCRS